MSSCWALCYSKWPRYYLQCFSKFSRMYTEAVVNGSKTRLQIFPFSKQNIVFPGLFHISAGERTGNMRFIILVSGRGFLLSIFQLNLNREAAKPSIKM